jgi:hypothetical protein
VYNGRKWVIEFEQEEMEMEAKPGSVMERLQHVHDPRRREGKRYNFQGLMAMLLLAALHGETSLRGMWLWGCGQWARIAGPLDLWGTPGPPAYATVWELMANVDAEELGRALCESAHAAEEEAFSADGKVLRGSRRATEAALQVVTVAGHRYHEIWGQVEAKGEDCVEAVTALLYELPLEGRIVSLDAGLLQRSVVTTIEEKGGPTSVR